jgi:hypothetical protein
LGDSVVSTSAYTEVSITQDEFVFEDLKDEYGSRLNFRTHLSNLKIGQAPASVPSPLCIADK